MKIEYADLTPASTWRPLVPVLEDRPLALCDSRSVDPEDLVPADRVAPGRFGEVYYLTHNPNHKWYGLKGRRLRQLLLILDSGSGSTSKLLLNHLYLPCTIQKMVRMRDVSLKFIPPRERLSTELNVSYQSAHTSHL
jgi:hypothetical protein